MARRNWKRVQPKSLRDALEMCKDYAREKQNLSVERIAERLSLPDHFLLYKWIQSGRMPAVVIPAYENVCGINFVTRWLAASGYQLLIAIPTGRKVSPNDVQTLQEVLHEATGALLRFYSGGQGADETIAAVQAGLEHLAWHRGNVQQHAQPQLDFGGER